MSKYLLAIGAAILLVGTTAQGDLVSFDDFSSGTDSGGTGWSAAWTAAGTYDDGATTAFNEAVSPEYLIGSYSTRTLTTPLEATTTADVWVAAYIRPVTNTGWQFGFEAGEELGLPAADGAQIGRMTADGRYGGARTNAEDITRTADNFVADQPTLLLIHLYKNAPADTEYNRADYYADLNGNDGRFNSLIPIATGKDLGGRSAATVSQIRLLVDGTTCHFDYVSVGTSQQDVLPPATNSGLYWDGKDLTANADGGTGTWDNATTNWDDAASAGADAAWAAGTDAVFGGTAGTVTVGEAVSVGALNFATPGYQLTGAATLTLAGSPSTIRVTGNAEIAAPLADGAGGTTKNGTGTLILSGASSAFTGPLTVAAGRLNVTNTFSGVVLVDDAGTLGGEGTIGNLTLGTTGGASLAIDVGTPGTLGVADLDVAGPVSLIFEGTLPALPTSITLLTYSGDFTGDVAEFDVSGTSSAHASVTDTGSSIVLALSPPEDITFTDAAISGEWFSGSGLPADPNYMDENWNSTDGYFSQGDTVTFDDSVLITNATFGGLVNLLDNVVPASVLVDNSTVDYEFRGEGIGGGGGLTKNNDGTLILNNPNTFTGGAVVNSGLLAVQGTQATNRLAPGSTVTVNNGGTFEIQDTNAIPTGTSPIDFVINAGGLVTARNNPAGGTTNHAHLGDVTLNGGTLTTEAVIGSYDGENYLLKGGVSVGGNSLSTLGANDGIGLEGIRTFTIADSVSGPGIDLLVSASLNNNDNAGVGGIIKRGSGTMRLSGTLNTYTAGTTIDEGELVIDTPTSIPADGTGVTVAAGAGFGVSVANFTDAEIATLTGNVSWDAGGTAGLILDTGGGTVAVGTDFAGLGFEIYATGGGTITLTGDVTGVTITDDGVTTVVIDRTVTITDMSVATSAGSVSGIKVTITYTATGKVDVYASTDLRVWGVPIATGIASGTAATYEADNLSESKRFFVLVPEGAIFPTP